MLSLGVHTLPHDASAYDARLRGRYLLVMERAERDLADAIAHDRFAGINRGAVRAMLGDVARVLLYLNDQHARVHGE